MTTKKKSISEEWERVFGRPKKRYFTAKMREMILNILSDPGATVLDLIAQIRKLNKEPLTYRHLSELMGAVYNQVSLSNEERENLLYIVFWILTFKGRAEKSSIRPRKRSLRRK
jgi:hypothetical protein